MAQRLEYTVLELIESTARNLRAVPLNLGGISGPGGGNGGPPAGFIGLLPQYQVAYDTTEAATLDTVGSGTLVDNLNHIRYRINTLLSGVLTVEDWDGNPSVYPVNRIIFSGATVTNQGYGRVLVTFSGGGGLDTAAGDARYLKLVADNDPLTGKLSIIPSADNTDGLYVETQGDAYGADIEQFGYGGETITSPALFVFRGDGDSSNPDYSAFAIEIQDDVPATANNNAGFLKYILNGATIFSWNARASATTVAYSLDTMIARTTGKVMLIRDADDAVFGVVHSGIQIFGAKYIELGTDVSKEANAGKIGYETFDAGYLNIVGAGTVAGSRKVRLYDDLEVSDSLSASEMNLTNPSAKYKINGSDHQHSYTDVLFSFLNGAQVPASTTYYSNPGKDTANATGNTIPWPEAGTLSVLTFRTSGGQPASGTLVITLNVNGSDTALTVTVPAGSGATTVTDNTNTVAISAGDLLQWKFVNNATAGSCLLTAITMKLTKSTT